VGQIAYLLSFGTGHLNEAVDVDVLSRPVVTFPLVMVASPSGALLLQVELHAAEDVVEHGHSKETNENI
jgi:hypothetical protein